MADFAIAEPPAVGRAAGPLGAPLARTKRRGPIPRILGHIRLIAGPTSRAAATIRDCAEVLAFYVG